MGSTSTSVESIFLERCEKMTVLQTELWLEKYYHYPDKIFEKLTKYFRHSNPKEIAKLLINHGMYHKPLSNSEHLLKVLQEKKVWKMIHQEEQLLRRKWNGKDIPIFIFPSDQYNRRITQHYNGRSGLSFRDKIFLFLSEDSTIQEIKSLFTHEYNHHCRLIHDPTQEKDYTLLDVMILEGLAEHAVEERFGPSALAPWTSYYTDDELDSIWKKVISPLKDLPKSTKKASDILYGNNFYPNMAGYCVGYYLIKKYAKKTNKTSKELLHVPTKTILSTI